MNVIWQHWNGRSLCRTLLVVSAGLLFVDPALADQEASNYPHVVASLSGRCYAKSVPRHLYDPQGEPRQQGRTDIYQVAEAGDVLVRQYDWFSQVLFVRCQPGSEAVVVRVGPWQRGHDPRAEHLAIAFYQGGRLIRSYSTLDIAGDQLAEEGAFSNYRNVSASVSHYSVFTLWPEWARITENVGSTFTDDWVIKATTVDGRVLVFDSATGELR